MVKQIPMYEDSGGTPHKTAHDAWKADLMLWLVATGTVNDASAKQLVEHIVSGGVKRATELGKMLDELADTMPPERAERHA